MAVGLAYITIVMGSAMTFIVLSAIADDFEVTLGAVGWVVIIESLLVSALLLPMGSVADLLGRRRVLLVGMTVFGVGSVLTGLAPTFTLLIVARLVMAFGNSMTQSVGTGMLVAAFPPGERGLALGAQTTAVSVGSASGPLIAGLALEAISWSTLFLLLAIPSALSVILSFVMLDHDGSADSADRSKLDPVGGLLSALAVVVLVVTINNPFGLSWTSFAIIVGATLAAALLAAFIRWELRAPHPMLELRLFKISAFRTAVVIRLAAFGAATTTSLLLPVFLLSVYDATEATTGLILFLFAIGTGVSAQISGRLYDRLGPRSPTVVGLAMQIVVLIVFSTWSQQTPLWVIAAVHLAGGISMGMWNVPNNSAMLGAVPPRSLGVGGAFTNVTRTMGNVLGQAMAAAVVVAVMASKGFDIPLGDIADTAGASGAFVDGWRVAFLISVGITVLMLGLATRLPTGASTSDPSGGGK